MAYSQMGSGFSGWNAGTTGELLGGKKEANILLSAFKHTDLSLAFGLHDTAPAKKRKWKGSEELLFADGARAGDSSRKWSRALPL